MAPASSRTLLVGCVCVLVAVAGCGGASPEDSPPSDVSPSESATEPPTATGTSANHTGAPETETSAPEGLLIVDVVENRSTVNESEVVAYDGTIVGEAPTLDAAITEAISTNATQTRDLSSREVRRVEAVAEEYGVPTGAFVVSKNGTMVHVSLGYEA